MITLIVGKRGSGKTTKAVRVIRYLENCIVLDVFDSADHYTFLPVAETSNDFKRLKKCRVIAWNDDIVDAFFRATRKMKNRIIVVEEIDRYCNPHYIHPDLDSLVRYGRHQNISIIGISRRPSEFHRHLTANMDELISFKIVEPRDLDYYRKLDKGFAERVQALGKYESESIKF